MYTQEKNIKVSVIVPIYNVEVYLRKSILSIMNQTLKDIEIILVNDGSTDNSLSIIKELAKEDSRIKICSQPNHGQSIARNIGLVNAIGKYIYFFDSDDILEEKTLEECYDKCELNQLDFLFFDADVFSDDDIYMEFKSYNRTNKFVNKTYSGTDLLKEQLANNYFSASVCLTFIKKEYLDNINLYFYPKIIHEDELFTFLLYLKARKIGFINKIYFHRRLRPNSTMTTNHNIRNVIGYINVCRELKKHSKQYPTNAIESDLYKNRIKTLLTILYSIAEQKLHQSEKNEIKNILTKEFLPYLNWKILIKLNIPFIYTLYKKINKG